jgi:hypothetical protein
MIELWKKICQHHQKIPKRTRIASVVIGVVSAVLLKSWLLGMLIGFALWCSAKPSRRCARD